MAGEDVIYELAARLGSISTFDRHGWVVWLDDFENGLRSWATGIDGAGASVAMDVTQARSGALSVKLTAGSDGSRNAGIQKNLSYPRLSKIGVEISFTLNVLCDYIQLTVEGREPVASPWAVIRYSLTDSTIKYVDVDGNFQLLADGVDLAATNNLFHTIKLVVDLETDEHVRLILDNVGYDMSGISMGNSGAAGANLVFVAFNLYGNADVNGYSYVDDFILTQNEP